MRKGAFGAEKRAKIAQGLRMLRKGSVWCVKARQRYV